MKPIQLTRHDGKHIGLPQMCVIFISGLTDAAREQLKMPDAKTLILADLGTGQRLACHLRDSFTHVLNLFPVAKGGTGWQHATDGEDLPFVFPQGAICAYEQMPERDDIFVISLALPAGPPAPAHFKGTFEELEALIDAGEGPGETEEAPSS